MAPILCYPTLVQDYKNQMIENYSKGIAQSFSQFSDAGPDMDPKDYELEPEKQMHQMNNYLIKNHLKFNKSQAKVLESIIELPKDEIMLVQGPPGTGKTHTIIGIISMLMSTRLATSKQKIMICAPSNAAIDNIISRVIERGLIGMKGLKDKNKNMNKHGEETKEEEDEAEDSDYEPPDLSQTMIRITGADYQAAADIKKHTLEQRIIKKLCIEKFGDLKKCIKELKEMIVSI